METFDGILAFVVTVFFIAEIIQMRKTDNWELTFLPQSKIGKLLCRIGVALIFVTLATDALKITPMGTSGVTSSIAVIAIIIFSFKKREETKPKKKTE
jgi:hypothetical protein